MRKPKLMRAILLAVLLFVSTARAEEQQIVPAAEAQQQLRQDGRVADKVIEGDLDLKGLTHPTGGILLLNAVKLHGRLINPPSAPLEVVQSELGGLYAPGSEWQHSITIEHGIFLRSGNSQGIVNLDRAVFKKGFTCHRCRLLSVLARRARFEQDADFSFSSFSGVADFSATWFRAAAFDGARFADPEQPELGPNFTETDFVDEARFANIDNGSASVSFLGASFHSAANFRGCHIGRGDFGLKKGSGQPTSPFDTDVAIFGGVLDFRRCLFVRGVSLSGGGLHAGARFDSAILRSGELNLESLSQAEGKIVLRDLTLGPDVTFSIDESAIGSIEADAIGFDPKRWQLMPSNVLDALAARAKALGETTVSRRLVFLAAEKRAKAPNASWTDRAIWALQWPTSNSTDAALPIAAGVVAWLLAALLTLQRGALVAVAPAGASLGPLAKVVEPLYRPLDDAAVWQAAACPVVWSERAHAAAAFGFVLVFKFGTRRFRPILERGWRVSALAALWVVGFLLVAEIAFTIAQLVPGLRDLLAAIPQ